MSEQKASSEHVRDKRNKGLNGSKQMGDESFAGEMYKFGWCNFGHKFVVLICAIKTALIPILRSI